MKIAEQLSEMTQVMLPNGMPASGRLRHMVYKVESDEEAEELLKVFCEGVDITLVSKDYIFMRKFEPSKFAITDKKTTGGGNELLP